VATGSGVHDLRLGIQRNLQLFGVFDLWLRLLLSHKLKLSFPEGVCIVVFGRFPCPKNTAPYLGNEYLWLQSQK